MAVTRAQIRDVAAPETVTVQVCLRRVRRFVAPGEAAFGSRQITAARGRGCLPLGLGWQAPACPAAVRLAFVPVDVDDRPVRFQHPPTIKITPQPANALTSPVHRVQDLAGLPPAPPLRAP